jgi:hypothetical protein
MLLSAWVMEKINRVHSLISLRMWRIWRSWNASVFGDSALRYQDMGEFIHNEVVAHGWSQGASPFSAPQHAGTMTVPSFSISAS